MGRNHLSAAVKSPAFRQKREGVLKYKTRKLKACGGSPPISSSKIVCLSSKNKEYSKAKTSQLKHVEALHQQQ